MNLIIILIFLIAALYTFHFFLFKRRLYSSNKICKGNNHIFANKLMIITHPDDELIFGGIELLKEKGWKVVCITNGSRQSENKLNLYNFLFQNKFLSRKEEFIKVMDKLNYPYEIWDFEDNLLNANWDEILLIKNLKKIIYEKNYEKIVTHNLEGEYGHIQHKKLSELVNLIKPKNLYVFNVDSKQQITKELNEQLNKLLSIYKSQQLTIRKNEKFLENQSIKKIN